MVKSKSIAISTLQVTAALLVIKLLGVAKQSIIASVCGATTETDAYFIASGVITALCSVIFSSISISLLSMYTDRLFATGRKSSNNLISTVLCVFVPISIIIAALFAIFAPNLAFILAPSYQGEDLKTLISFIRIMSIMFVFTSYYLIVNVVLEADKRFLPGKGQSFFQNLFVIIASLFFYSQFGISALLYSLLLAGLVQCIQITWNARKLYKFTFKCRSERKSIVKLLKISGPLLIGNAIYEINDIVDKQISSGLGEGSVSILTYGASINEIVTTLLISSISTVLFSHYTTWVAKGEKEKVGENLKISFEYLITIIMPAMIMCFVCGDCIVDILYGRGSFGSIATDRTSGVVMGYAIGFIFQAARANIVKVFYAFQDTKTPMINGAISVIANICMSIYFSRYLGVSGIALSTSLAMLLVTVLLFAKIKKYLPDFSLKSSVSEYLKVIGVTIFVAISANILRNNLLLGSWKLFFGIGFYVIITYSVLLVFFKVRCICNILKK